jgi:hypothetical protein
MNVAEITLRKISRFYTSVCFNTDFSVIERVIYHERERLLRVINALQENRKSFEISATTQKHEDKILSKIYLLRI